MEESHVVLHKKTISVDPFPISAFVACSINDFDIPNISDIQIGAGADGLTSLVITMVATDTEIRALEDIDMDEEDVPTTEEEPHPITPTPQPPPGRPNLQSVGEEE